MEELEAKVARLEATVEKVSALVQTNAAVARLVSIAESNSVPK